MPRWTPDPDVAQFLPLVDEFLTAVTRDVTYAVAMAQRGAAIRHRRDLWQLRIELRRAEGTAIAACRAGPTASCDSLLPCGIGSSCRLAEGDLAELLLEVPTRRRSGVTGTRTPRPQLTSDGLATYSELEPVLRGVLAARAG